MRSGLSMDMYVDATYKVATLDLLPVYTQRQPPS